jgi:mannosyltransferase OCH1-like enzyme
VIIIIPKTIHYCWFGKGPKPELALKCIESWKVNCPDYQVIEWNEYNFDISSNMYVKQAYDVGKYAFVSDFVRLYIIYTHGGIYMDTDVAVLKSIDRFLEHKAFIGFESHNKINTGIVGAEKHLPMIGELLFYYNDKTFLLKDGVYNITTNVEIISEMLSRRGLVLNGAFQELSDLTVYPQIFFCPDLKKINDVNYLKDTYTIHYFAGSWKSAKTRAREKSLWWKMFSFPGQLISKGMKFLLGEKWVKWKNNIRDKVLHD